MAEISYKKCILCCFSVRCCLLCELVHFHWCSILASNITSYRCQWVLTYPPLPILLVCFPFAGVGVGDRKQNLIDPFNRRVNRFVWVRDWEGSLQMKFHGLLFRNFHSFGLFRDILVFTYLAGLWPYFEEIDGIFQVGAIAGIPDFQRSEMSLVLQCYRIA